ncbi:MAG: dTMP kinase [Oceanicaulis sp.]
MPERGLFITLEGGEGAGKTTLAASLSAAFRAAGRDVVLTREPGGTPNAEALRALLVEGETGRWSPMAETLLMFAARVDHVERLIRPALERGAVVICDRFTDSTRAYQGAAGGVDRADIEAVRKAALGPLEPDLTFILDLDPAAGLDRTRARGEAVTRFERQPGAFHAALRQAFLDIAAGAPERCVVLDGAAPAEGVAAAARAAIAERLGALA